MLGTWAAAFSLCMYSTRPTFLLFSIGSCRLVLAEIWTFSDGQVIHQVGAYADDCTGRLAWI